MRFDVITLFPELFAPHLELGVTRRAFASRQVDVRLWPLREHGLGAYRRVDDRPFGGGPGMVLLVQPLEHALAAVRAERDDDAAVVLFSPSGRRLDQGLVADFSGARGAILVCGRYEGVDQRFVDRHVDVEVSLGDFVLSGGELPALALLDAVARLQPGVLHAAASPLQDSFAGDGLLEGPQYSRPERLDGAGDLTVEVPAVLRSGDHAAIARWRRERSLERSLRLRPDLIEAARRAGRLSGADEQFLASLAI